MHQIIHHTINGLKCLPFNIQSQSDTRHTHSNSSIRAAVVEPHHAHIPLVNWSTYVTLSRCVRLIHSKEAWLCSIVVARFLSLPLDSYFKVKRLICLRIMFGASRYSFQFSRKIFSSLLSHVPGSLIHFATSAQVSFTKSETF